MAKFLIVRFSSIGDIILTTPVIRCLQQQVPGSEVHYATKEAYRPLLEANSYIDKLFTLKDSFKELTNELKQESYHHIIDLHHNLRSSRLKMALGAKAYSFNKTNLQKWLVVNTGINLLPDKHIVERYMETLKPFEVENDGKGLDYFIPEGEAYSITQLPASHQQGFIAFAIGGKFEGKRLNSDNILRLCQAINKPVVLLGGGREDEEVAEFVDRNTDSHVLNLVGQCSLHQSASLIQQAGKVITHDTGMMHIAAAYKKDICSIWGCTVPEFGMYPYLPGNNSIIIEPDGLSKRPCSKLGNRCKYEGGCINRIPLQKVIDWAMA